MILVSLFADASYCHKTGAAGWGAWAKSERGSLTAGGEFAARMSNANDAEMCAIINGMHLAFRKGVAIDGDRFLIQTDCEAVIRILRGRAPAKTDIQKQALAKIRGWVKEKGISYLTKHVKGHTRGDTPRTWVNNQCDLLARQYMEKQRKR